MGGLLYALKAMEAAGLDSELELQKQLIKLPDHLRDQVTSGINMRLGNWESERAVNNEYAAVNGRTKRWTRSRGSGGL